MLTRRQTIAGLAASFATLLPSLATAGVGGRANNLPPEFAPRLVRLQQDRPAGEIHVVPDHHSLYWTLSDGQAIRYFVGLARDERYRSGTYTVRRKAEWPSWTPTPAMIRREPAVYARHANGMAGGPDNPLGARALYLFNGAGRDSYMRIHGTNQPGTISRNVSNGCVRLINAQVIDLYDRVPLGTPVFLYRKGLLAPITTG
ncbi:L,D-transpeptidase [Octadecabacter sp. R77987]|uniref:L,D-transpeptidase n=1 Tax=Octadecabacter sp. R77987 TaxID=3093874 RepID=UPI00366DC95B